MKTKLKLWALALAICSPLGAVETVVVYRSKWEAETDAFWYDFFSNNPWLILVFIGLFIVGFLAWLAVEAWNNRRRRW